MRLETNTPNSTTSGCSVSLFSSHLADDGEFMESRLGSIQRRASAIAVSEPYFILPRNDVFCEQTLFALGVSPPWSASWHCGTEAHSQTLGSPRGGWFKRLGSTVSYTPKGWQPLASGRLSGARPVTAPTNRNPGGILAKRRAVKQSE